jgi:hypothetical protein
MLGNLIMKARISPENGQIHAQFEQKPGNGKLGDFTVSVGGEMEMVCHQLMG